MLNDLQKITDELAADLNRAVFVEDGSFRPLAASAQIGRIDEARVRALLERNPTEQHLRYFIDCGVTAAREPLRIPASPSCGLLPRVMIPVLAGAQVLARIWLIDADPPVDDDGIVRAIRASQEMQSHLLGRSEEKRRILTAGGQLLRDIQRAGTRHRQALFRQLQDDFEIADLDHAYPCVINFLTHPSGQAEDAAESDPPQLVDAVLDTFTDLLGVRGSVAFAQGDDVIALISSPQEAGETLLEQISAAAHRAAELHNIFVNAIGLGGALESPDSFGRSFHQAEFAAKISNRVPELNGRAWWETLGEYRLFSAVEWNHAGVASINQGVASLIAECRIPLAATLLAYLEREGNVSSTSDALNIHRTTLYYRIERAKELLGEEPTGQSRFAIHAALRLADLAGLLEPTHRH